MRPILLAVIFALGVCALSGQEPAPLLVEPATLPPVKTALVFGQKIVYFEAGRGPTIVLVHGFASQAIFDWGNVITPLAKDHRVIALDQIGFGASDKPLIDYSIQTFVDFLGEFLRTLNIQHFALAGESLGGWIAAAYTIQSLAPTNSGKYAIPRPERLILEDAAGHTAIGSAGHIPLAGSLQESSGVAIVFYDKSRVTEEFIRQSFALKLKANDGATQRSLRNNPKVAGEVVGGKLASITIPTLVVWGGNDELVPIADGRDYAARIPDARLAVIPHCGHAPSLERPTEFLAAVIPFLDAGATQVPQPPRP